MAIDRDLLDRELDHAVQKLGESFAASEPERTAWLEAVIDRRVIRRE